MAHRRPAAGFGGIAFVDNDRFVDLRCDRKQPFAVGNALEVEADDFGLGISPQIFEEIVLVEVQFIADAGEFGESDLFAFQQIPEKEPEPTALGDHREPALFYRKGGDERQAQAMGCIGKGQPIGTDEADAVFFRTGQ